MANLTTVELKAFVPAKDFEISKKFYEDLGFTIEWSNAGMAYIRHGDSKFLLQNYYVKELAENLMMHLLVEDVDAWWQQAQSSIAKYSVNGSAPEQQPWGIRDFTLHDPSGVLWRVGEVSAP